MKMSLALVAFLFTAGCAHIFPNFDDGDYASDAPLEFTDFDLPPDNTCSFYSGDACMKPILPVVPPAVAPPAEVSTLPSVEDPTQQ